MPIEVGDAGVPPASSEDVRFLPSGKIQVSVNGSTLILRRPKLGEFRRFREVLYEEQDLAHAELLKKADAAVAAAAAAEEIGDSAEVQRDQLREIVEAGRKIRIDADRQEEHYVKWSRSVVETLSDRKLEIEDEELPFLFSTGDFVTAVQRHWRTVPLPSGVR